MLRTAANGRQPEALTQNAYTEPNISIDTASAFWPDAARSATGYSHDPNDRPPPLPARDCLVGQLLAYAAAPPDRRDTLEHWRLEHIDDRQFEWVMEAGLGALLCHATRSRPEQVPAPWRERLLSAELTARMRHADRVDTACEVIDLCAGQGVPVTLLKGISTSEELYPAPHLRPMGDIDLLVPPERCREVHSMLKTAGYREVEDYPDDDVRHHGPPLYHPKHDVCVEMHRSLFPKDDDLCMSNVFSLCNVEASSVACTFHGLPARRLCPELQLIYIASSWMRDLTLSRIHASFLASLFDALFLTRHEDKPFAWIRIAAWSGDDMPTASLHVLLSFLARRGLRRHPTAVMDLLAKRQQLVGALQTRAIHAMLDRYLIAGRSWRHVLPPPVAGRYSVHRQWVKRVLRRPYGRTA